MYHPQKLAWTCGPSALRNALSNLGIKQSEESLAALLKTNVFRGTYSKNFGKAAKSFNLDYLEFENTTLDCIQKLIWNEYQVLTCFYIPEEYLDHYTLIKSITRQEVVFQDPHFGDNYSLPLDTFYENWFLDPHYECGQKWLFAIKKQK